MTFRVVLQSTGAVFGVEPGETVLDAALRQDVRLAHECTFGGCGTCRVKLVEGSVEYTEMPLALSEEEASCGYALACQARPRSDLVIVAGRDDHDLPEPSMCSAVVRGVRRFTPEIVNLQLEVDADLAFVPGQHMNVLLDDGGVRSFSMASAPQGNLVDFHVRQIPGGQFTDAQLAKLSPGDRLAVEIPLGNFRYRAEDYRALVMVATGTGLAPIKSILEGLMDDEDCPPVSLYWGMRTEQDLYLAEEIGGWGAKLYDFQFVPVLSRAHEGWKGRRGHVQQAVVADWADLSEHSIYACGSPAMIRDAKREFLAHRASVDHIYTDGFSFHHDRAA